VGLKEKLPVNPIVERKLLVPENTNEESNAADNSKTLEVPNATDEEISKL
jgi:hypothetical protein